MEAPAGRTHPAAPLGNDPRRQVAAICRRLYERGLVTSVAGNVSAREGDRIWIKPSGFALDAVTADDLVAVGLDGHVLEGRHRPSTELPMHLAVYRANAALGAVVHTHSPAATAFAVLGQGLTALTTEAEMLLGDVPLVPYAAPGSAALGEAVGRRAADPGCRVVLLERHGVVAWAEDVWTACHRAELAEETARVHLLVRLLRAAGPGGGGPGSGGGPAAGVKR